MVHIWWICGWYMARPAESSSRIHAESSPGERTYMHHTTNSATLSINRALAYCLLKNSVFSPFISLSIYLSISISISLFYSVATVWVTDSVYWKIPFSCGLPVNWQSRFLSLDSATTVGRAYFNLLKLPLERRADIQLINCWTVKLFDSFRLVYSIFIHSFFQLFPLRLFSYIYIHINIDNIILFKYKFIKVINLLQLTSYYH